MKTSNLSRFTNLYSLSKTLCFELQPVGKTKENIEKNGILIRDEKRAEDCKKVKELIDEYHKQYIKSRLWDFKLPLESEGKHDSLEEYKALYDISKRSETEEATFKEVKDNLRSVITQQLTSTPVYKRIKGKELIREDLIEFLEDEEDKEVVSQFADFTTYFSGFRKNRENMYDAGEKSTAIAYRLINQNLPKFIDNMKAFEKIAATPVAEHFVDIFVGWKEYLNVGSIEELFSLDYFSDTLTQPHIEVYNYVIGKKVLEDGSEIKGINEYVNLYNQQLKNKDHRLPLLVPLYKQILSDREKLSWLAEEFDSDEKMLAAINETYVHLHDLLMGEENDSLRSLLMHLKDFDLTKINITNDLSLTDISQHLFGRYDVFTGGIKEELRLAKPRTRQETDEQHEDRIAKIFKAHKSFSIARLNSLPQPVMDDGIPRRIEDYFMKLGAVNTETTQKENHFARIENAYEDAKAVLQMKKTDDTLSQNKSAVSKIKALLDALKDLQHFIRPLLGSGEENEKDELFYGSFQMMWDELESVTPLYNKVRNWLTRKPFSTEKIKLNFDNAQLLDGWDENKEIANASIILCKDGFYYLGIIRKDCRKLLGLPMPSDGECYDKIVYKFFKDITTMVPKCTTQKKDVVAHFTHSQEDYILFDKKTFDTPVTITKEIFDLNNVLYNGVKKFQIEYLRSTGDKAGYEHAVSTWKSFCMQFLKAYKSTSIYNLALVEQQISSYYDLSSFYDAVNLLLYNLSYRKVSVNYIDSLVDEGKLYLFRIWNKDFSEYSNGTPNLHTLYWKMLFDERNLADVVYKLNGQAEVFYRKSSIKPENRIIHPAHHPISNKNELNQKHESTFKYDIIKDRRYTVDKFQFHVPITINFKAKGQDNINPIVQDSIRHGGFTHIIGIDRGERHLLYLSLIDLQGNIVKQMTLHEIINEYKGNTYKTNYHDLLAKREGKRTEARRSWDTIENIKEIKEGYLSQVVHVISKMMVEYNAIVVLEDLNMGFMQSRQKFERQVYEKFEKMLIDKLNCYVDKQSDPTFEGGMLHALQLTNKFESFRKLGKQSGCLFYIPAWNTSKIDPVTGFVNLFDTRYDNMAKAKSFFGKFKSIRYNTQREWFEFAFDYNDFTTKAEETRTEWTLCTYGERILTFRNPDKNSQWDDKEIVLTQAFKQLFEKYDIDIHGNMKEDICTQNDAQFFKDLLSLMKLLLQMRNSKTNSEVDYLLSPVADEQGRFFDSRSGIATLPDNADANGAYNIARKGLWVIRKIQETAENEKLSLTISNREWLQFAQTKPYLND
ncbi:MAG: type V CRISPR-associated protein Cas12a/Cpf1 [Bacteroidaceae bacterium]|nr:type V CRISPR-associated protein Cas12a/Cpf1 [Bacteroidaceae bacterium]